jgi:hypothetical protein
VFDDADIGGDGFIEYYQAVEAGRELTTNWRTQLHFDATKLSGLVGINQQQFQKAFWSQPTYNP